MILLFFISCFISPSQAGFNLFSWCQVAIRSHAKGLPRSKSEGHLSDCPRMRFKQCSFYSSFCKQAPNRHLGLGANWLLCISPRGEVIVKHWEVGGHTLCISFPKWVDMLEISVWTSSSSDLRVSHRHPWCVDSLIIFLGPRANFHMQWSWIVNPFHNTEIPEAFWLSHLQHDESIICSFYLKPLWTIGDTLPTQAFWLDKRQ